MDIKPCNILMSEKFITELDDALNLASSFKTTYKAFNSSQSQLFHNKIIINVFKNKPNFQTQQLLNKSDYN